MNIKVKRAMRAAILAAAVGLTAILADAAQRTFNLPVEAHWGSTLLKPGEYTIGVPGAASWPQRVFVMQKGKLVSSLLPLTEESGISSEASSLQLVTVGHVYFVREYISASTGKRFTFRVPKGAAPSIKVKNKS